jgi:transcriptional regulator with XRE-family HTH domain
MPLSLMLIQMGFKENLKSELTYKDMLVKELAAKAGISRHTLNNYLNVRGHIPTLDIAVKIAQALGVSVEYLAIGKETSQVNIPMSSEITNLLQNYKLLNDDDRKIVSELVELLKKHHRKTG